MNSAPPRFRVDLLPMRSALARWHRLESKRHILRSQLGFTSVTSSRPKPCQGCIHYHGVAYGYTSETRTRLICGFHPYGWHQDDFCPDWCSIS